MVLALVPGNRFRVVATLEASELPEGALIRTLLDTRGPSACLLGRVSHVSWASRSHVHHCLVETYRTASVFLAGNALHGHSPAAGLPRRRSPFAA
jgi:2-polyprenyl-6-methoxyphenol hydroxylase-like FAD-dependent oxidoreductase